MALLYTDSLDMLTGTAPAEASVGVTGTTTGVTCDVSKRRQISVAFRSANGTGTYSIDGSNDGGSWVTSIACTDTQGTALSTGTTSVIVASTIKAVYVPPGFRYIRAVVAVPAGGTHFAYLHDAG